MGPSCPGAEIPQCPWKALRDNLSQGDSASSLIPPYPESRMKNKAASPLQSIKISLTVQERRWSFKCCSAEKGGVEEDLSVLLLDRQNWSHAKTNNKQKRPLWYLCNNKRVKQHRRKAMKEAEDKQNDFRKPWKYRQIVQLPKKWNKEPKRTIWWEKKAGGAKEETDKKLKV